MSSRPVTVVGYCEPLSCHGGDRVELKLSSEHAGPLTIDIVELICGDGGNPAVGFVEREVIVEGFPLTVEGRHQPLEPGSFATIGPLPTLTSLDRFTVECVVKPYVRAEARARVADLGDVVLGWSTDGFDINGTATGPLDHRRWYELTLEVDRASGQVELTVQARQTHSPGIDSTSRGGHVSVGLDDSAGRPDDTVTVGRGFDGRVGGLTILGGDRTVVHRWDASVDVETNRWVDVGPTPVHGVLHQLPARAIRGADWDGTSQDPSTHPSHYDAVHFHTSDLYDAGWDTSATLDLPPDHPSGIYAFRTRSEDGEDRTPFFVAAPATVPAEERADVAFLVPVATYLAYANQRIQLSNPDFFSGGAPSPPAHLWLRDHPEVGFSLYEYHHDRTGVMFSSRRRPVINMKPGADGWAFTPDTNIVAFLHHAEVRFDVVTDEQLHEDPTALDGYRVVVTASHPEYWSTAMLDGLEDWQRGGGRLMYLGGNGFYWRVAFSDHWPGAMEVRRAEDGTRAWIAEVGEYHHAFGGEYGGMWRRQGRAPNMIAGIGFAAQGFGRSAPYVRTHDEPERTDWIFEGVERDVFGDHGVGGGAAGQEIDRFEPNLGSPRHTVVVASATEFGPDMLRTKEEFHHTVEDASSMSTVRADMVFFEVEGGGAVFSTGSIGWFGSLASDGYDNDVARITRNVLQRFVNPKPFTPPSNG
ncbi:MAG: N,N-dimethylformamidase beta subunit family domain-containing protein [Acidimicrobiales bacterium]